LHVPFFVSEFGACLDTELCAKEIHSLAKASDDLMIGWTYWQFKGGKEGIYGNNGLELQKSLALSRTYF